MLKALNWTSQTLQLATRIKTNGYDRQAAEFQPEKERISSYLERVQMFFEENDIAAEKQVAVLLTAIGVETYALL